MSAVFLLFNASGADAGRGLVSRIATSLVRGPEDPPGGVCDLFIDIDLKMDTVCVEAAIPDGQAPADVAEALMARIFPDAAERTKAEAHRPGRCITSKGTTIRLCENLNEWDGREWIPRQGKEAA